MIFCLLFSILAFLAASEQTPLVTRLYHYDSTDYNPNQTTYNRAERLMNISIARLAHLSQNYKTQSIEPHLIPIHSGVFFVKLWVGTPSVPQLTIMDTGSDLIWMNCNPHCTDCATPIFNPSKSRSFLAIPCSRPNCNGCTHDQKCMFIRHYGDGSEPEGVYATDKLTFTTHAKGFTSVTGVVFGCSLTTKNEKIKESNGIFGLGLTISREISIVKILGGSGFSYCVGDAMDQNYQYSSLVIGEGSAFPGPSTPLILGDGRYYVNLEAINVGGNRLPIDPRVFERNTEEENSGVIIDSGSVMTWLTPVAYEIVSKEIDFRAQGIVSRAHIVGWITSLYCYSGDLRKDMSGFPAVTFHFSEGADLVVDIHSLFLQYSDSVFCLAMAPTSDDAKGLSVIGMLAQQHYNVGYDVARRRLHLRPIDCKYLVH